MCLPLQCLLGSGDIAQALSVDSYSIEFCVVFTDIIAKGDFLFAHQ